MPTLSEAAAVRRLVDRYGFGLSPAKLAAAKRAGFDDTLSALLAPKGRDAGAAATPAPTLPLLPRPPRAKDAPRDEAAQRAWRRAQRAQTQKLTLWWLDRMVAADHTTTERLTWFWHGHFATSVQKVNHAPLMLAQNQTFRRLGRGRFEPLAQALAVDPAMLVWLDGNDNTAKAPNENLSREYMELFTLGHGAYTENDVKQGARALTGWTVDRSATRRGKAVFRKVRHDAGDITLFGTTGPLDAEGFVSLVLDQPSSAGFVVDRLWFRLVSSTPADRATRARLVKAYGSRRDITALLRAMARTDAFTDTGTSLVKQPVEWLVGLCRAWGVRPSTLEAQQRKILAAALRGMGQTPFRPPSVGGWPAAGGWLTTGAALARLQAARMLAQGAPAVAARKVPTRQRPEALRRALGVDRFSTRTVEAVRQVADDPVMALAVAACSPEYTVSG